MQMLKYVKILMSRPMWRRGIVSVGLPLLAGLAYFTGNTLPLVFMSFLVPALLLRKTPQQSRPALPQQQIRTKGSANLEAALDLALDRPSTGTRCVAIALELSGVGHIKGNWGADTAEHVVLTTQDRLCAVLRPHDIIARVDETTLGIVLSDVRIPELAAVVSLIERLKKAASRPIQYDNAKIFIDICAGFCLETRATARSGKAMCEGATLALLDAKQNGHGSIRGYSKSTPVPKGTSAYTRETVLKALEDGEIIPWFQPQISTDTGQVTGFEALARWQHPERGIVAPFEFIPVLEKTGRMEALRECILQQSLKAIKSWDASGYHIPSVSVNFSTQDLRNPNLVERIKWDVDRFDLDPSRLTVEILETVASNTEDDVITRNIRALGAQGFRVDLDDFGTGHASIANIRRFAVDRIKIDRSFVTRVDTDAEQQLMVGAIISMADRLGIETLAEGVETIGEKSILSQLGSTHLQGFAIARPMPLEQTMPWLQEHTQNLTHSSVLTCHIGQDRPAGQKMRWKPS